MTFSITGWCPRTGRTGIAMATSSAAVGNRCIFVGRDGAVAFQSVAEPRRGALGLRLLQQGISAKGVLQQLVETDYHAPKRQIGIVDSDGNAVAHTGEANIPWAGHIVGKGFVAMGNVLAGPVVAQAIAEAFEDSAALELEERLMLAIEAGRDAGGQEEGQTSAALFTHNRDQTWSRCDLRVDVHEEPVAELRRIYEWYKPLIPYFEERTRTSTVPRYKDFLKAGGHEREYGKPVPVTWKSKR